MRNLCEPGIAKYRDGEGDRLYGTLDHERALGGAFLVPFTGPDMRKAWMRVIASSGADQPAEYAFDHVSVSLSHRCPTWAEMDFVKRLFFKDDEIAYQLHMPPAENISNHEYCLHIWRPLKQEIPLPPPDTVGYRKAMAKTETAVRA
jgi:hypothetical protein